MSLILKNTSPAALEIYLRKNNWLYDGEQVISTSIPGSGNMNYVIRVHTSQRTVILKQSMPYVEKYPSIEAPQERIKTEYLFYRHISSQQKVQQYMPVAIGLDLRQYILVLEDAGAMQDATSLYSNPGLVQEQHLNSLLDYLNALHSFSHTTEPVDGFENSKMKTLNAVHIFSFPFQSNNGFNLDNIQSGLQAASLPYKQNNSLKKKISQLQAIYMDSGKYLLHGDYYPGSWLVDTTTIKVIDPEFCFYGTNVFDLSVLIAHLKMARCSAPLIQKTIERYQLPFDKQLLSALTGVEILRRIIGLAQLPLHLSLAQKQELMEEAVRMI
jgi:5-methylthioribose kinase